jgi:predicted naringenin-chalcone synthase
MFITGLGTAVPPHRYTQRDCWEALQASPVFLRLAPRSRAILKKVLTRDNGIATRHFVLDRLADGFELTPDSTHRRFREHAPRLAAHAAERALADAALHPRDIDALLVSTCTGYLCPGLTSYVGEHLGIRPDALALDFVGQGCGAALPNLRAAEAILAAERARHVLSICVEICSAAIYFDDDIGVLISACLFGDGAAAAVLSAAANGKRRVRWKLGGSLLRPGDRDLLRFEQVEGMLRNILRPEVPTRAAQGVETVLADVLARAGVDRAAVRGWALHPGGRDVLTAVRQQLGLRDGELSWSEAVLHEFGNMSSPSVLFALQAALDGGAPGGWWWMSSFGAGFSCHGALLEVE